MDDDGLCWPAAAAADEEAKIISPNGRTNHGTNKAPHRWKVTTDRQKCTIVLNKGEKRFVV